MAAASYYQNAPAQGGLYEMPAYVPPLPAEQPHRHTPSIYSEGPPPYSPGLATTRTPQQQYAQQKGPNSYQAPYPASYSNAQQHLQPYSKQPRQPYQPQPNSASHPQPYQPQSNHASYFQQQQLTPQSYPSSGFYPPQMPQAPKSQRPNAGDQGYYSDPEPERRRHHHKHQGKRSRSRDRKSKGSNHNAVLGATGGALIGDLIFPGLGTVVVGGLGGWYAGRKIDKADKGTSYERKQRRKS